MFNIGLLICGMYFVALSLALNTKNFKSALLFKIIPFFCGLYCLFYFCVLQGWLKI